MINNAGDDSTPELLTSAGKQIQSWWRRQTEMIAQEESSGGVDSVTDGASDRNRRISNCSHKGDHDSSLAYPGSASAVEQRDGSKGLRTDT